MEENVDSDSDDDDATLRAKRAKRATLRPTAPAARAPVRAPPRPALTIQRPASAGSFSKQVAVPPTPTGRHSTPSPSVRWNPQDAGPDVRAGDLGVTLHSPAPVESHNDSAYRLLLSQNASIMAELAKQSQQLISLQQLVYHLCRELGEVHNKATMLPPSNQVFNPYTDQAQRPGPKDESPPRGLDPREIAWLHGQMEQLSSVSEHRCEGFRRIVDPLGWHQAKEINVPLVDLDWRKQWQLWHYAFGDQKRTSLTAVMTAEELEYSNCKKGNAEARQPRPLLNEETFRAAQFQLFSAEADEMRSEQLATTLQAEVAAAAGASSDA